VVKKWERKVERLFDTLLPVGETIPLEGRSLRIEKRLNAGLTGEVYKGTLQEPGREPIAVAVKAMKSLEFEVAARMFQQEMLTLARMRGLEEEAGKAEKNELYVAPEYHGRGDYNGVPFLIMEFIDGVTIPDLLRQQGKLPEVQALTAGWHLYRTLNIMHSRLRKTYIDLKFENLWWVGSPAEGQLKLTDFGTLEEIKGDPRDLEDLRAQRGIRRDLMLAGVYLLAMLTGRTLSITLGVLKEPAEPVIRQNSHLSWGTQQLLQEILHRNPDARLKRGAEIAQRLYDLVTFWQQPWERLYEFAVRQLDRARENLLAAQNMAGAADNKEKLAHHKEVALAAAREARATLDILRLQTDEQNENLQELIQRAEELLEATGYMERGQALLVDAGSYPGARKAFEEGRDWSGNIARFSWWSYVARVGEEVPSALFTKEKRQELINIVRLMEQEKWEHALRRLDELPPDLKSTGLKFLRLHCYFFHHWYLAENDGQNELPSKRAEAYKVALEQQKQLPEVEQRYLFEEIGDLRPAYEEMLDLAKSQEESEKEMRAILAEMSGSVAYDR
jgi:hypothetical protein